VHGRHATDWLYASSTLANAGRPDDEGGETDGTVDVGPADGEAAAGVDVDADCDGITGDDADGALDTVVALGATEGATAADDAVVGTAFVWPGVACGAAVIEQPMSMNTKGDARRREGRIERS
jgi:hypothetical protein